MNKSIALAADASPLAAFLAPVLMSDPSRMLIPILTRALPSERLGRDDRLYSFESPYLVLRDALDHAVAAAREITPEEAEARANARRPETPEPAKDDDGEDADN